MRRRWIKIKVHENRYYIKKDRWDDFLKVSKSEFGFKDYSRIIYPKYIIRDCVDGYDIRIGISQPCVNVWNDEDKNEQREIWLWRGRGGNASKKIVKPYINDLIEAGFIE